MSIKKGNRKRTRRDYNFIDFEVRGFCYNWATIRRAVRKMFPKNKYLASLYQIE